MAAERQRECADDEQLQDVVDRGWSRCEIQLRMSSGERQVSMSGLRTHVEMSYRMLRDYLDESANMLPGIENVFADTACRGAFYWGSVAPDWWGVRNMMEGLRLRLGDKIARRPALLVKLA
jgi:hypothetical protein